MPDRWRSYTSSSHTISMILNGPLLSSVELSTGELGRGTSCTVSVVRGSWLGLLCCVSCCTAASCAVLMRVVSPAVLLSSCVGGSCSRVEAAEDKLANSMRWASVMSDSIM